MAALRVSCATKILLLSQMVRRAGAERKESRKEERKGRPKMMPKSKAKIKPFCTILRSFRTLTEGGGGLASEAGKVLVLFSLTTPRHRPVSADC